MKKPLYARNYYSKKFTFIAISSMYESTCHKKTQFLWTFKVKNSIIKIEFNFHNSRGSNYAGYKRI